MFFWAMIIIFVAINICMIVWLYELRTNSITQTELLVNQNKITTAQLHLLAGIADKLGMPVNDINEVVSDFGVEYE